MLNPELPVFAWNQPYGSVDGAMNPQDPQRGPMPKRARVAIIMAAMVIFAVVMLNLVRSKVEASGQALKTATVQYSTIKRIYAAPAAFTTAGIEDKQR